MPTNPPTPADRLAAVKDCVTPYPAFECDVDLEWDEPRLIALLAADPPGATVTVLCACGCPNAPNHTGWYTAGNTRCRKCNECRAWQPTTARVSYERKLTEEERTR